MSDESNTRQSPLERGVRLSDQLRELAYDRAGGHTGDRNYDPQLLAVMAEAADCLDRFQEALEEISKADMTTKGFRMLAMDALEEA